MKTFTVGVLSLATLAAAQGAGSIPNCAIECFQSVITDHPPLECKEADMYHCFCKDPFGPALQRYFAACARSKCDSAEQGEQAIAFGVDLCAEIGFPITVTDVQPPSKKTTSAAAQETSKAAEPTSEAPKPTSTESVAGQPTPSGAASTPAASTPAASTPAASASTPAAETSKPAVQSTATASATGSVSAPHDATVTKGVAVTTTVCKEESSKHSVPVVTVTSAHWECPHGCNGTVSTMTKIPKPVSSQPAQIPPCNGECHHTEQVPSSPSDKAHPTPSQGAAKPSGTGVVAPTKSVTPSGSAPVASPSTIVISAGASASVSGFLAAAGVAVAVFRLL